jgi:photosynthetic reaction center H subunit
MTEERRLLAPLAELDGFEVADGDPDVSGWDVISADGRRIGSVSGLLVDTAAMRVRYLEVAVDETLLRSGAGPHRILVPIGYARVQEQADQEQADKVRLDEVTSLQVGEVPPYDGAPLTPEYESAVLCAFDPRCALDGAEGERWGPAYDAERFYGVRGR